MRTPYRKRRIHMPPQFVNFKPSEYQKKMLERVELTVDEYEAIRLADYLKMEHLQASEKMNISRPTFTRLIDKAREKVARVIIDGMELVINGGNIDFEKTLQRCHDCGEVYQQAVDQALENCPDCGSSNLENLAQRFVNKEQEKGWRKIK